MLLTLKAMKRRGSEIGSCGKATKVVSLGLYKSYLNHTIMTYRILRAIRLPMLVLDFLVFLMVDWVNSIITKMDHTLHIAKPRISTMYD